MEKIELKGTLRKALGTADAKRLRRDKQIPAVVYGKGTECLHIALKSDSVGKLLSSGSKLVELTIEGQKHNVVLQDIQREPISGAVIHIDFHKVELSDKIHIEVPIEIFGQPKCPPSAGTLDRHMDKIMVECLASAIPNKLVVDVRELDVGGIIRIQDLKLPEGVKTLAKPEDIIVSVTRVALEEEVKPVETPTAEVTEPEVIERRKKEEETEEEKK
jgi:large subunit ribosomal protein L25